MSFHPWRMSFFGAVTRASILGTYAMDHFTRTEMPRPRVWRRCDGTSRKRGGAGQESGLRGGPEGYSAPKRTLLASAMTLILSCGAWATGVAETRTKYRLLLSGWAVSRTETRWPAVVRPSTFKP